MKYTFLGKLNCLVPGKLKSLCSYVESTRIKRTKDLNLKQSANQSRPEVLP